ncbi:MAG: ABC transporter substrate-binding protein, partial [Dehalococcoidia bacterium]
MRMPVLRRLSGLCLLLLTVSFAACGSGGKANTPNKATASAGAAATAVAANVAPTGAANALSPTAASFPTAAGQPGAAQRTTKVGVAFSLTQAGAVYGATQKNGAQLAADEINLTNYIPGIKLQLIIDDDASDKQQGISVFQKFVSQDKVTAIIGPTLSNTAQAADPVAQTAKVPVLAVSNTGEGITTIGDYIFRDS